MSDPDCPALVRNFQAEGRLVYLKDINLDAQGNPVILVLTSADHKPGPSGDPRIWTVAHWTEGRWEFRDVTHSTHNYDMGSLYIEADGHWRVIAPTEPGPQHWGTGGDLAMWVSPNQGIEWRKAKVLTANSRFNHAYARRPVNAHPDFYAFWADGNPDQFSESRLYLTNQTGDAVWTLPDTMDSDFARPQRLARDTF